MSALACKLPVAHLVRNKMAGPMIGEGKRFIGPTAGY